MSSHLNQILKIFSKHFCLIFILSPLQRPSLMSAMACVIQSQQFRVLDRPVWQISSVSVITWLRPDLFRLNTHIRSMAAILRSGKFLRLFSGVARNLAASSGKNEDNGLVPQHGLSFDRNFSQANFSIQNVLPYLGVSDSGHAEDRCVLTLLSRHCFVTSKHHYRFPTRLLSTPNRYLGRVSKEEIELMIAEIEVTEADVKTGTQNLLSSQALLAIR